MVFALGRWLDAVPFSWVSMRWQKSHSTSGSQVAVLELGERRERMLRRGIQEGLATRIIS
jgi:hypothetical protein